MIAPAQPTAPSLAAVLPDQFVASYGKSGGLGCFTALGDETFSRGDKVALQTPRGLEAGAILGAATLRQARLLGAQTSGTIVRRLDQADLAFLATLQRQANELFSMSRAVTAERGWQAHVLDVELLLDGAHAIVHLVARAEDELTQLTDELCRRANLQIRFENLALPIGERDEPAQAGCGKPDCGKASGGGCSDCGAGGCSSCGQEAVDLRPYFAHLRTQMEQQGRTPLV
jgi:cell fate regulator YaaT (PSP1 superfamily)